MKRYKETQKFHQIEAFLLVGLFLVMALVFCVKLLLNDQAFSLSMLLIGLSIALVSGSILYYLLAIRVDISISDSAIKYKYRLYPFLSEKQKIKWKDVEKVKIVETPLSSALSGYGVHFNTMEKRVSLNGYNGISLTLKNGKNIFLGSQNVNSLRSVLSNLEQPSYS